MLPGPLNFSPIIVFRIFVLLYRLLVMCSFSREWALPLACSEHTLDFSGGSSCSCGFSSFWGGYCGSLFAAQLFGGFYISSVNCITLFLCFGGCYSSFITCTTLHPSVSYCSLCW
jgi:hypothetical protein